MTREQIEQTPTGRELDALVAERIFGWQWAQYPSRYDPTRKLIVSPEDAAGSYRDQMVPAESVRECAWLADSCNGLYGDIGLPPAYSTTGDGMMLVLRELGRRRWTWTAFGSTTEGGHCAVEVIVRVGEASYTGFAQEMPEAICRAALRAVLSQPEGSGAA